MSLLKRSSKRQIKDTIIYDSSCADFKSHWHSNVFLFRPEVCSENVAEPALHIAYLTSHKKKSYLYWLFIGLLPPLTKTDLFRLSTQYVTFSYSK